MLDPTVGLEAVINRDEEEPAEGVVRHSALHPVQVARLDEPVQPVDRIISVPCVPTSAYISCARRFPS